MSITGTPCHCQPTDRPALRGLTLRLVETASEFADCIAIRLSVFVDEQHVPIAEEIDTHDAVADHWLACLDGRPVGAARLMTLAPGVGRIGRVAVLAEQRGRGIGRALMDAVMDRARGKFVTVVLDAQLPVIGFYESFGFVAEGGEFLDAGILHRRMRIECAQV